MSTILPPARPMQSRAQTAELLIAAGVTAPVALFGKRGYYRDSMGQRGANDRGIFDDAIFLFSATAYASFNANTDPSSFRPGHGTGARKGLAVLDPGLYSYRLGTHGVNRPNPYTALVQAASVAVTRDAAPGEPPVRESGFFGINIHRGGRYTTSSAGCQTIWPDQWPAFLALVRSELKRHGQRTLPYLLCA